MSATCIRVLQLDSLDYKHARQRYHAEGLVSQRHVTLGEDRLEVPLERLTLQPLSQRNALRHVTEIHLRHKKATLSLSVNF